LDIRSIIKNIPVFAGLRDEIINKIIEYGSTTTYYKNQMIIKEGEESVDFCVVLEGSVRVSSITRDQREFIFTFINEGEHFGEISLMDGFPSTANVIAAEECRIYKIHRNEFYDLLSKFPEITFKMLTTVNKRLREADQKIKNLTLNDAEEKVAATIIELAEKYGEKGIEGSLRIKKLPQQRIMAKMAGVARETISRQLHYFMENKFIKVQSSSMSIFNYKKFRKKYD